MRLLIALRWNYRVLTNTRAKLDMVELLMRYRFSATKLKRAIDSQEKIAGRIMDRDMERSIWRDYSYFRFCLDQGAELFEYPYDETGSPIADGIYYQLLLGLKHRYRRLLRRTPTEWGTWHRQKLRHAPVRIPKAIQEKRAKRSLGFSWGKTTQEEAQRKHVHAFRQSVVVAVVLFLLVVVNALSGNAIALPNTDQMLRIDNIRGIMIYNTQRDAELGVATILKPQWLPWDDYAFTDSSVDGIMQYSYVSGSDYIDFYLVPYGEYVVDTEEVFDEYFHIANREIKYLSRTDRPDRYYWDIGNTVARVTTNLDADDILKVISFLSEEEKASE